MTPVYARIQALGKDIALFATDMCRQRDLALEVGIVALVLAAKTSVIAYKQVQAWDPAMANVLRDILRDALKELE